MDEEREVMLTQPKWPSHVTCALFVLALAAAIVDSWWLDFAQEGEGLWYMALFIGLAHLGWRAATAARWNHLRLTPEGMCERGAFWRRSFKWEEIAGFDSSPFRAWFTLRSEGAHGLRGAWAGRARTLWGTYSMRPKKLAAMLNEWKDRHTARAGGDAGGDREIG